MSMWDNPEYLEPSAYFNRKVLERRKVGVTVWQSAHASVEEDMIRDELQHRLEAYLLTDHVANDEFTASTQAQWPDSTWQMFKSRHAESWWLRWLVDRYPVRMHIERQQVVVRVERYLGYPEANLALPELGRPVIFETARQMS